MNLLLISANREHFPDPVFPLGPAYAAGAALKAGHSVEVLDLAFVSDSEQALTEKVRRSAPSVIAFSFRNLDNAAYPLTRWYLPDYRSLVRRARAASEGKVPIVVGGSAFSLMPGEMLEDLEADYGVSGESEEAFPALLDCLEGGESPHAIPGVVGRCLGPVPRLFPIQGEPGVPTASFRPFKPGGSWTSVRPARDLFEPRRYARWGGMLNLQTKRGCAFRCRYCTYPVLEGSDHRLRDPASVADEVEEIVERYGIRSFFFVDSVFNLPASHAEGVADALIRRNVRIRWSAYASPAGLTRSLLEKMAAAGCDGLEVGTDSADGATLLALGKGFSRDRILEAAEDCHSVGIPLCHSLVFGGPGETPDTVENTCRTIDQTRPMAVVAMAGVRLYPGTPLGDWAMENGLVKEAKDFLRPQFYLDPAVRSFLLSYLERYASSRGNWILPGVVPPLRPVTQKIIRFLGYKRPLWHLLRYGVLKDRVYRDR